MLQVTEHLIGTAAQSGKRTARVQTISGQFLAKTELDPQCRASFAAAWVAGLVNIQPPTVVLASKVFGVSVPLVQAHLKNLCQRYGNPEPLPAQLDHAWRHCTWVQQCDFVRTHERELWFALDTLNPIAVNN